MLVGPPNNCSACICVKTILPFAYYITITCFVKNFHNRNIIENGSFHQRCLTKHVLNVDLTSVWNLTIVLFINKTFSLTKQTKRTVLTWQNRPNVLTWLDKTDQVLTYISFLTLYFSSTQNRHNTCSNTYLNYKIILLLRAQSMTPSHNQVLHRRCNCYRTRLASVNPKTIKLVCVASPL